MDSLSVVFHRLRIRTIVSDPPASIRTTRFTDEHDIILNAKVLGFIFITAKRNTRKAILLNANHAIRTNDAMHHSATGDMRN